MRTRVITIFSILILAGMLAACNAPAIGPQPAASDATTVAGGPGGTGGPGAGRTPGGQRGGGNGTPGAGFPGRGGGTPGAGFPGGRATAQAAASATAQAGGAAQPTATTAAPGSGQAGVPPTAVPVPIIDVPTPISGSQTSNNPTPAPIVVPTVATVPLPAVTSVPPTSAPGPSLQSLKGKIVFFSDRGGSYSQLWVMNADGSNQQLCNCSDLLQDMVNNEVVSPDKQQFLFVKTVGSARSGDIQIWRHNNANNTDEPVTGGAPGFPGVDYAPVWSPDSRHIAWVTEKDKFDEIYLYDAVDNSNVQLTRSSGEWYKHPSFSPDGSHITFWSNLNNLNYKQIWVMNLDGSGKVNLSNNNFNDWDPIWVK